MRERTRMLLAGAALVAVALLLSATTATAQEVMVIKNNNVGIRTNDPKDTFHIFSDATSDIFAGMGVDPSSFTGPAFNFGYCGANCGQDSGFFNVRASGASPGRNPALLFMTGTTTRMLIDNQGYLGLGTSLGFAATGFNPAHPIHHDDSGARLTAAGVWTNGSSRAMKSGISTLSLTEASQALDELLPVHYTHTASGLTQVGFIAEDVPELVASPDRKGVAAMDVVAVLTKVLKDQRAQIATLEARLAALEAKGN